MPATTSGMTLMRLDILADIEHVADEARDLPTTDLLNVFHSLCTHISRDGAGYTERVMVAAYAIAITEHNMTTSGARDASA